MKTKHLLNVLMAAVAAMTSSVHAQTDKPGAAAHIFDASNVENTLFGKQGDPMKVTRTIRVGMSDKMRFEPENLTAQKGETVRFVVANKGAVLHEMVLGTTKTLKEHAELMKKHPGMEHDEPSMAHVNPRATGEIIWQFTQAGEFQFACLIPGHYDAGMVGKVTVK